MILEIFIRVIALLVTLGILVTIHEFGHFWVARRCGVKVLKFSIGFGKAIKTWVGRDGVEYIIAPIPLGGYVKMLGQEDTAVADTSGLSTSQRECSFACKPLWQKTAIVAAGPVANFLLAIFVFWLINISYGVSGIAPVVSNVIEDSIAETAGLRAGDEILAVDGQETIIWQQVALQLLARMGETGEITLTVDPADSSRTREIQLPINAWMAAEAAPNPVGNLGIIQFEIPADIAGIVPGGAAEAADLREGDEIISVDGKSIRGWTHWVEVIRASPELTLNVAVQRGGINTDLLMTPKTATLDDGSVIGSIGAYVKETTLAELLPPEMQRQINYNVLSAIQPAISKTLEMSIFILNSVKKMITLEISPKNIGGPITIAKVAGETATLGPEFYLGFLALLSISLGVMNLLPIPVLDGGHLLFYAIEAVIRRPVPERIQAFGLQLGLLLISGIMVLAIYNDVSPYFRVISRLL
jgi:regulator of sigma E protease